MVRSINPYDQTEIARYDTISDHDLDTRLQASWRAFERHRRTTIAERGRAMHRVADRLETDAGRWGKLMTTEMGKPVTQAEAEARKCAWVCRYYAENAERQLADEPVETDARRSLIACQPLGPILAVMPWNFPFWQVLRFAAPAIMAGNTALLKHASNVTECALAIERIFAESGFDPAIFQTLILEGSRVAGVIADPRVRATTLTGSDAAGRSVGCAAGTSIKPSVLELGGSDPFVVLADADLDTAASLGVTARMQNNGQSCIAAKRFIVEHPVLEAFVDRYLARMDALTVGDPLDRATDIGPLARLDLKEEVQDQVERAVSDGARILVGGPGEGCFYLPTVLTDVREGSVAFREEIFGPVAAVTVARDAEDALRLANATSFGLGGAVFTRDLERGEAFAREMEVGCAFVNGMVKSDPRLPFGGVKESGYGRELSWAGIRSFVNTKTIWVG